MTQTTTVKIECNFCGKDISPAPTMYPSKYIPMLTWINVALPDPSGAMYAVMSSPRPADKHFCDQHCLGQYAGKA
jgi:hypothetical protein